jgi:hypothetical protein
MILLLIVEVDYTYFDRSNQSFIVEWYNMKNGYNGSSIETFQVILYDQAVYSTSLGDGPIKFQYHTFNNIDVEITPPILLSTETTPRSA